MTKREALRLMVPFIKGRPRKYSSAERNNACTMYYEDQLDAACKIMEDFLNESYDPRDHFGAKQTWLK